jgi:multicomponent Na+:H+ antiporter subunit F
MPHEVIVIAIVMVAAALLFCVVRLVKGPTLPDRIVASDLMGICSVGLMVLVAAAAGRRWFLDVAVVVALLGFLGTVAYARYAQRQNS